LCLWCGSPDTAKVPSDNISKYSRFHHKTLEENGDFPFFRILHPLLQLPRRLKWKYFEAMLPFSLPKLRLLLACAGMFYLQLSCISRDNPWDPIYGCHPDQIAEIRDAYQIELNKLGADRYYGMVAQDTSVFTNKRDQNSGILEIHRILLDSIELLLELNSRTGTLNDSFESCELALPKTPINIGLTFYNQVTSSSLTSAVNSLSADLNTVTALFNEAETICPTQQIFTTVYRDTILLEYDRTISRWNTLIDTLQQYSSAIADSNRIIDSINRMVIREDSLISLYNDSLAACRTTRITDPAKIDTLLDSLQPGDTIALGEGTFNNQIYLEDIGSAEAFITIMGVPYGKTIIDSSNRVQCENAHYIRFEHLVFNCIPKAQNGVRITGGSSNIVFNYCTFSNNSKYGIEAASGSSDLLFTNCRFINNGTDTSIEIIGRGGLRIDQCTNVTFTNILVARNTGIGIDISGSVVDIQQATIADNLLFGLRYSSDVVSEHLCTITKSIFSFNDSVGIYCNNQTAALELTVPDTAGNRFYRNTAGEMGGDTATVNANKPFVSDVDPMYTDRENGGYHIGSTSLLYGSGIGYHYPFGQ
jgi:hypothetical protein